MRFGSRARRRCRTVLTAAALCGAATVAIAQRGGYYVQPKNPPYNGRFTFARLSYVTGPGGYYYYGMPAWAHGYPQAETNLMQIMGAITDLAPRTDASVVANLDDPNLDKYPVAYMTEAGFWTMNDKEAAALRAYLLKGGFVIFDDFRDAPRGGGGWGNFAMNMERVIPGAQFVDLKPSDPIFHVFFDINTFDIVPQYYDYGRPVFRGLYQDNDPRKRLMAVVNFNTDISNFWEFAGQGFRPVDETNEAYKLGVNYVIYGLTH
jgi:Domain of unknown function (DUF4159)